MSGVNEEDGRIEGDKPTDRYRKVSPGSDGAEPAADHTPLATDVSGEEIDPLTGLRDESEEVDRTDDAPFVPAAEVPRKTQRYERLMDEIAAGMDETDAKLSPDSMGVDVTPTPGSGPGEDYEASPTPIPGVSSSDDATPAADATPVADSMTHGHSELRAGDGAREHEATDAAPAPSALHSQFSGSSGRAPERPKNPMIGKLVGGLVLEEEIGRGGMGVIYRGRHPHLRKDFAIKILPERLAKLPPFVERFINEGRAAGRITHPSAVRVNAAGIEGGVHFIVMELVRGRDLRKIVEDKGAMHEFEVQRIALEVTRALIGAHSVGIIHRDIKPENLIIEPETGRVRVTDFGLSMDTSTDLAAVEASIGTPNYMSPEQCRGLGCEERSDIYALGATCYFLLTHRPPFSGHTAAAVMIQHIVENPPDPRVYAPRTTDGFAEVVMRMMAKERDHRYPSALALADVLEGLRHEGESQPRQEGLELPTRPHADLTRLLNDARDRRAEAVHLHLEQDGVSVSYRVDGAQVPAQRLELADGRALELAIREASGLAGATPGSPRHGKLEMHTGGGGRVPVFVGVLPGATTEHIVLRLLPGQEEYPVSPERLGLTDDHKRRFADWASRSRGVLIATGPAASGRARFLYGLTAELARRPIAVTTIEPQVRLLLDRVTQMELDPARGITQSSALRACCDQDVDACMITEVEGELWPDVFAAAAAGRLMLASAPQPDGVSLLRRLLESGVSADRLRDHCLAVVTSRVLPVACNECHAKMALTDAESAALGFTREEMPVTVLAPAGCARCKNLGTVGREVVREVLVPSDEVISALTAKRRDAEVRQLATDSGAVVTLTALLRERVVSGRTRVQDAIGALAELHGAAE